MVRQILIALRILLLLTFLALLLVLESSDLPNQYGPTMTEDW